ncbi:MAG: HD domain-containing protein [Dechloromonas sp.]|nr:HD domain-containing protein [Dechloromonas sp.]
MLRLKQRDLYSFDHTMDVAVNMMLIGAHIGWRGQRLLNLGMAGILQDVGKLELPSDLLENTTRFGAPEFKVLRSHVARSVKMLQSQAGIASDVILTVSRHHERWNGSGYPAGLKFEQIGMAAEIAGLADSHCAMLRDKPYRRGLGHQEALEKLHRKRGTLFNPALMEQFVQCVGLYPIGTLVELDSGEVGVVIQQNRVQRSKPCVLLLLDADRERVSTHRTVDLREKANTALRVAKALPYNAYGLDANVYYLG